MIAEFYASENFPMTVTFAVGIDRERLDNVRKAKNIPVRVIEEQIQLSKTRYYRWLNYEIDLPAEYVFGMKKMFGISNDEFWDFLEPGTSEPIQALSLLDYWEGKGKLSDHKRQLDHELQKHDETEGKANPYRNVRLLYQLYQKRHLHQDYSVELSRLTDEENEIQNLTLFDVILTVILLQIHTELSDLSLFPDTSDLELWLIRHVVTEKHSMREALIGFTIDLAYTLEANRRTRRAVHLLGSLMSVLAEAHYLTTYTNQIIDTLLASFHAENGEESDRVRQNLWGYIERYQDVIPEGETAYWQTQLS
ncbi:hypothetical protein [Levilactobacillus bambusae]|nr:hypothetical protein [Levilactobacillus bambusae]